MDEINTIDMAQDVYSVHLIESLWTYTIDSCPARAKRLWRELNDMMINLSWLIPKTKWNLVYIDINCRKYRFSNEYRSKINYVRFCNLLESLKFKDAMQLMQLAEKGIKDQKSIIINSILGM